MEWSIDVKKSVTENLEAKQKQWAYLQQQKNQIKEKIDKLNDKIKSITKEDGKSRKEKSDLVAQVKDLQDEYALLEKKDDLIPFMAAYRKWTETKKAPSIEREHTSTDTSELPDLESQPDDLQLVEIKKEENQSSVNVSLNRTKNKKKKSKKDDKKNMIRVQAISTTLGGGNQIKSSRTHDESSKQLAQWLKEVPLDQKEKSCPYCPGNIILLSMKQQPTRYCPNCGFSEDIIDTSSALIHDKETNAHTPFAYRPYFHFKNWVQFFIDEQRYTLEQKQMDMILLELANRGITDLKNVNWEVINKILHYIAQHKDRSFTDLYPHVYQITNLIRGAPVVTFSEDLKKVVFDLFHPIFKIWEPIKQKLNIDRENFLSNPIILQIIFIFLEMPPEIISMLNMLKGEENLQMYDTIIKEICIALKREDLKINTSVIANMRYGKTKSILDSVDFEEKETVQESVQKQEDEKQQIINSQDVKPIVVEQPIQVKAEATPNEKKRFVSEIKEEQLVIIKKPKKAVLL